MALITKLITKLVHSQKAKCSITGLSDTYYTGWDNKSGSVDEHFFDKFISKCGRKGFPSVLCICLLF